jgi:hypothetical protein
VALILATNNSDMISAVISGDIVASTSLDDSNRVHVQNSLKGFFEILNDKFKVYGRIIKGDYIECVVPQPADALTVTLAIKSYIKSIHLIENLATKSDKRIKLFKKFGIRLAIGYGELSRYEPEQGIIDGEAIYLSGRTISNFSSINKERIVIKNTLFFVSANDMLNQDLNAFLALLDVLVNRATSRQCEVLYHKLLGYNEEAISRLIGLAQSTINQHSRSVGWHAIDKAISYYSEVIKNQ